MPRPFSRIPGEALFFCLLIFLPAAAASPLPVPTSTAIGGPRAPLPALTGIDRNIMSYQADGYKEYVHEDNIVYVTVNKTTPNKSHGPLGGLAFVLGEEAGHLSTLLNAPSASRNVSIEVLTIVDDMKSNIDQAEKLLGDVHDPQVSGGNLYLGSRVSGREGHTTTTVPDIIFGDAVAGYDASLQEYVDGNPGTGGSFKYAFGRERTAYSAALDTVLTDKKEIRWLLTQPRALLEDLNANFQTGAAGNQDSKRFKEITARLADFSKKFPAYVNNLAENSENHSKALSSTLVYYVRALQASVYVTGRSYIGAGDFTGEGITVGQLLPVGKGGVTASLLAQAVQFSASGAGGTHPSGVQSGLVLVWQEQASNFDAAQKPIIHYWHYKIGAEYFTPALGQPETFDVFFRLRLLPSYLEFTPYYVFPQHNVKSYPGINFGITVPVSF